MTGIGVEEQYRSELIGHLKAYDVSVSGKESIKQLETLLKNKTRSQGNGK